MKRLIKNIIFLAGILILVNLVVHSFLPFSWGDKDLHSKLTYYNQHKDDYSALFVGGSLVYRHVDPYIADSIAHLYGVEFHSFNAGGDGIAFLKQLRILESVLQDPSPNLEYAFMTLSSTSRFRYKNLHTKRFTTWQRPKDMVRAVKLSMELPLSLKHRLKTSWFYIISTIENGLNVGLLNDAIQYLKYPETAYDSTCLGPNSDGFFPYDLQEKIQYPANSMEYRLQESMILSHETYKAQSTRRDSITDKIAHEFDTYNPDMVLKSMLNEYNKLIKRFEEKGIKLIIIMPPKTRESYNYLIPVFDQLPANNKINLANPKDYPEYYEPENCYNFHHLNLKGAKLFSEQLAYEILALEGIEKETDFFNELNETQKVD